MKTTINTCIMIAVNNPSAAVMDYLAKLPTIDADADVTIGSTPVQPQQSTQPDPQATALRIASAADIDNYLDVGTEVHWQGTKFAFDGVVEKINDDVFNTEGDLQYDVKAIFVRRNDTGKLVSLTLGDITTPANSLTPLVEAVEDTPLRSWEDLLDLQEGMSVRWQGQKYAFDGVVEKVDDYILNEFRHDDGNPDEKILFIRRDDTGKLVTLTMNDLQVGRLTLA